MKPTLGAVDLSRVKRTSASLDTMGLFARHPEDLGLLLAALGGNREAPSPYEDAALRFGLIRTPWWEHVGPDSRGALEQAASVLRESGVEVSAAELPAGFEELPEVHDRIFVTELAKNLAWEYDEHRNELSDAARSEIERGRATREDEYEGAVAVTGLFRQALEGVFERWDAVLVPAVPGEAPRGLEWTGDPIFCRPWSLLGTPAAAVPMTRGSAGLPVGVQLVGAPGTDQTVLQAAMLLRQGLASVSDPLL